jgi:hypothetical protein
VVVPMMTYQAYNGYGGADLYEWPGTQHPRASTVSFDRPYDHLWGAGLFFRLDFPLIVWLEDHGYNPSYISDLDIARTPSIVHNVTTLVFSGHSEYWTGGMRDTIEAAAKAGTNMAFLGANQAFWQVRLTADQAGHPYRNIVCYKSSSLDPLAALDRGAATVRFEDPAIHRPPAAIIGQKYGGIVRPELGPMTLASGVSVFAPDLGLQPGNVLPGIVGQEVDEVHHAFTGILLGASPVVVVEHPGTVTVGTSLWISPAGNRVFDAGSFDYAWGLDPRYSADLPGFPAEAFSQLTARILAWLGSQPG